MMKRYLFSLLSLLLVLTAGALPISRREAQRKAEAFVQKAVAQPSVKGRTPRLKAVGGNEDAYYIFNVGRQDGFVVVAADDRLGDVIGYTTAGQYSSRTANENLRWWLGTYRAQARQVQGTSVAVPARRRVEPLLTTEWNQDAPYNLQCPQTTTGRSLTGCVATAMAQIVQYHRLRKTVNGIPSYVTDTKKIPMKSLPKADFDWEKLRDKYDYRDRDASALEVSKLMLYCGQAMRMDYSAEGSGANVLTPAFVKYFGFAKGVRNLQRAAYTAEEWENLIYREISERRPVLYTGGKVTGAHAFVCDGYDGKGFFHINWGWGGESDGYFRLSLLNPSSEGLGSSAGDDGYTMWQSALVGLQEKPLPEAAEDIRLTAISQTFSVSQLQRGGAGGVFTLAGLRATYSNQTLQARAFDHAWGLYQGERRLAVLGVKAHQAKLKQDYELTRNETLEFGAGMGDGEYRLIQLSRERGKSEWEPCLNSEHVFLTLHVTGNLCTVAENTGIVNHITGHELRIDGPMEINAPLEATLQITNKGYNKAPEFYLFVDNYLYTAVTASVDPGKRGSFQMHFTPLNAGRQKVKICIDRGGLFPLYKDIEIDIKDLPEQKMKMALTVDNTVAPHVLNAARLQGRLTVENIGANAYADSVVLRLYKMIEGYGHAVAVQRRKVDLPTGGSTRLDYAFEGLDAREEYFVAAYFLSKHVEEDGAFSPSFRIDLTSGASRLTAGGEETLVEVYTIDGRLVGRIARNRTENFLRKLSKGVYIVAGKKVYL